MPRAPRARATAPAARLRVATYPARFAIPRWVMAVTMVPAGAGCDGSRLGYARDAAAVAGGRSPRVALSSATRSTAAEVLILARPSAPYGSRIFGTTQPQPVIPL